MSEVNKSVDKTVGSYDCSEAIIKALKNQGGTLMSKQFLFASELEKCTKLSDNALGRSLSVLRDLGRVYTGIYVNNGEEIELAYAYNDVGLPGQIIPDKLSVKSMRYNTHTAGKDEITNKIICLPEVDENGRIINGGLEKVIDNQNLQKKIV